MLQNLTKKQIKSLQTYTKLKKIKKILHTKNVLFFFNYEFFTTAEQLGFKQILKNYNLSVIILNKTCLNMLLKDSQYMKLKNILTGNVLIIYANNLDISDNDTQESLKNIIKFNKLNLLGGILYNKIYRRSLLLNFINLKEIIKYEPIQICLNLVNTILFTIKIKKNQ